MKKYLCVVLLSLCFGTVSCLLDIDGITEFFTQGEDMCENCKTFVNDVKGSLVKGTTKELLDKYFLQECCKQEVEDYAALIFQLIENKLDPVATCQALGLCPQSKYLPMSRIGLSSALTKVEVIRPPKKMKADPQCVLCEYIMSTLDGMFANKATEAEIEAALDRVCSYMPRSISKECQNFVDTYAPMLIKLLVKEEDPERICTQLGLCAQAPRFTAPDPACLLCEFVLSEIDTLIGNNKSQASVEAALKKVCDMMPDTINAECRAFVDDYGPAVINLIDKELDPTTVCKTLNST